jgi:hypothetical protein
MSLRDLADVVSEVVEPPIEVALWTGIEATSPVAGLIAQRDRTTFVNGSMARRSPVGTAIGPAGRGEIFHLPHGAVPRSWLPEGAENNGGAEAVMGPVAPHRGFRFVYKPSDAAPGRSEKDYALRILAEDHGEEPIPPGRPTPAGYVLGDAP